jgi:hypothetical protein
MVNFVRGLINGEEEGEEGVDEANKQILLSYIQPLIVTISVLF